MGPYLHSTTAGAVRLAALRPVLLLLVAVPAIPAALAGDWPQFGGVSRDGKSAETGLLRQWPEGGPELLWKAGGLGRGWTSATVADGTVCATATEGETDHLFALDLDGNLLWRTSIGRARLRGWPGTRSNPTVDGDRLYVVSGQREVAGVDRVDGRQIWSVDTEEKFGTVMLSYWGNAESPLVVDDMVIFTPGGPEAGIVALRKMTGDTVWICSELSDESADCSPILVERGGLRIVVTSTSKALIGVELDTGELLWTYPRRVQHGVNATSPAYDNGCIYTTSGYGGALPEDMPQDLKTGEILAEIPGVGKGSLVLADGMIYACGELGMVGLIKADPDDFRLVSSFRIPDTFEDRRQHWAHPVVAGGRLYIRYSDAIRAYDIREK